MGFRALKLSKRTADPVCFAGLYIKHLPKISANSEQIKPETRQTDQTKPKARKQKGVTGTWYSAQIFILKNYLATLLSKIQELLLSTFNIDTFCLKLEPYHINIILSSNIILNILSIYLTFKQKYLNFANRSIEAFRDNIS